MKKESGKFKILRFYVKDFLFNLKTVVYFSYFSTTTYIKKFTITHFQELNSKRYIFIHPKLYHFLVASNQDFSQ